MTAHINGFVSCKPYKKKTEWRKVAIPIRISLDWISATGITKGSRSTNMPPRRSIAELINNRYTRNTLASIP
jgi:hypothetical protein